MGERSAGRMEEGRGLGPGKNKGFCMGYAWVQVKKGGPVSVASFPECSPQSKHLRANSILRTDCSEPGTDLCVFMK